MLDQSIRQLAITLREKKTSARELVVASLERIKQLEPTLHNFLTVIDEAEILRKADDSDSSRTDKSTMLHGIPFGVKDCYITKGIRTTAGSKVLDSFIPPFNATVVDKLTAAGAILVGKQSMDSWGHGGSNENTEYTVPTNPWDITRSTGGSSGGSAGAVAAREVLFSIGEDTGGSIRNPASMCNISGLKVTYGRVSRYGAIAYASSLDTVGPMAKSAEDVAIILNEIAGPDPKDASSSQTDRENYLAALQQSIKGKVIGLPKEFFVEANHPEVSQVMYSAIKVFESLGATIKEVSIPIINHNIPIYYMLAASETSSNLARYDGIRFGNDRSKFTQENNRRIMLGTYALSAGYADELYVKAQMARTALIAQFNQVLSECDVLLGPVTPILPPLSGELINHPLQNMLSDLYTVCVNIVGVPALALPAGFSANKLPIGMQIIGKKFHEGEVLAFGHQYQQVTEWHKVLPEIANKNI